VKLFLLLTLVIILLGCKGKDIDTSDKTLTFAKEVVQRKLNYLIRSTERNYREKISCERIAERSHHFEILDALKICASLFDRSDNDFESFDSMLYQFQIIDSLIVLDARYLGLREEQAKEIVSLPSTTTLNELDGKTIALSRIEYAYWNFNSIANRGLAANHVDCLTLPNYYPILNLQRHDNNDSVFIDIGINQSICPPEKAQLTIEGFPPKVLDYLGAERFSVHKDFVRKEKINWSMEITNTENGRSYSQDGYYAPVVAWF